MTVNGKKDILVILQIILILIVSFSSVMGVTHHANVVMSEFHRGIRETEPLNDVIYNSTYLTTNIVIPSGKKQIFENTTIIAENLTLKTIAIWVIGTLVLDNSTLEISTEYSSAIRQVLIHGLPNSTIIIKGSKIISPGEFYLNQSSLTVINSSISPVNLSKSDPFERTMRIVSKSSSINVINSSIGGLLNCSGNRYFSVAVWNSEISNFAQNSTIPLNETNITYRSSYVVSGDVAFNYSGVSTEDNNSLVVLFGDKTVEKISLPWKHGERVQRNQSAFIFSVPHLPAWFRNKSNFQIKLLDNSYSPVEIRNLSLTLISNDTVSLYPVSIFNYILTNSTLFSVHSSLGINDNPLFIMKNILNPEKNRIIANRSSVYIVNSIISGGTYYSSSPFCNINSDIYLSRIVSVRGMYHKLSIINFHPAIRDGSNTLENISKKINSKIDSMMNVFNMLNGSQTSLIYGYSNGTSNFTYTGNYEIGFMNSSTSLFLPPFPSFNDSMLNVELSVIVPEVSFHLDKSSFVSGANSILNFSMLSSYLRLNTALINATLIQGNRSVYSIHFLLKTPVSGNYSETFYMPFNILPGSYTLKLNWSSNGAYVTNSSAMSSESIYVFPDLSVHISGNFYVIGTNMILSLHIIKIGSFEIGKATLRILEYEGNSSSRSLFDIIKLNNGTYYFSLGKENPAITRLNVTLLTSVRLLGQSKNSTSISINVKLTPKSSYVTSSFFDTHFFVFIALSSVAVLGLYTSWKFHHTYHVCKTCGGLYRGFGKTCENCKLREPPQR